ncbi:MAG TPA: hypothetical protein VH722_00830 [Alphaproteobacteria bacterium]|nr:hypothetical protein [Alphaproteobacteria bacterium]
MTHQQTFRFAGIAAALLLTACSPGTPNATAPDNPAHMVHKSCEQTCNSEYDACMDRFAGAGGGPGLGRHQDDANADLGPNDVCPDQLKSCLKRCSL